MGDGGLPKRVINLVVIVQYPKKMMTMTRYAPFNWGLSFMAVPIPIMIPSCIVRILSCVTSILNAEGVQ
jgi:hypothetical protein